MAAGHRTDVPMAFAGSTLSTDLISEPGEKDAREIIRLARRCLPEFRQHPELADEKLLPSEHEPDQVGIGVRAGSALVGYAVLARFRARDGSSRGGVRCLLVDPAYRRRGVGSKLLDRAEIEFSKVSVDQVWLYVTPANYLYPGAPEHDAEIEAFSRAKGYSPRHTAIDMGVDLQVEREWPPIDPNLVSAVGDGPEECTDAELMRFVDTQFPGFSGEVLRALAVKPSIAFVARSSGEIVGFCVAGGSNLPLGGVGPAGVSPEHRGGPVFRSLVQACMLALKARGHGFARMQWADPRAPAFYKRWFDGFVCGRYRIYAKELPLRRSHDASGAGRSLQATAM